MSEYSPAPGTPQTSYKAYVATGLSVLVAFLLQWVSDEDPFTHKEMANAFVYALLAGGVVGLPTYATKNKPKGR